jgi:hypothetical protein
MKILWLILALVLTVPVHESLAATSVTNATSAVEKSGSLGTIIITQNGSPTSSTDKPSSNSVPTEWVLPILKLIIWPSLIAGVIWGFRKEISKKLANVASVKGGKDIAVEFTPDLREQQKASAPTPSTTEIAGNNQEFTKLKTEASTSGIVRSLAAQIQQNLGTSHFTDAEKIELGALIVAGLRIDGMFWRTYTLIFGTQVALLQELNSRTLAEHEIQTYFTGVQSRFPEA